MASQIFSKFIRPEDTDKSRITDRDLDIIEAVLRYRFSPTSELGAVGGRQRRRDPAPAAQALGMGRHQPLCLPWHPHPLRVSLLPREPPRSRTVGRALPPRGYPPAEGGGAA